VCAVLRLRYCTAGSISTRMRGDPPIGALPSGATPPAVIDHPCPFPEEIPDRLIRLYSYVDDIVLDPFMGSGQTLKVAAKLERQYVGYETIEKYVQLAKARIKEGKSAIRPQQLIVRFDKVALDEPTGKKKER
jgi:DNA modification methylase